MMPMPPAISCTMQSLWIPSPKCTRRCAQWVPPVKDEARHGMQYTIRFAFKRDGEIVAPPRTHMHAHSRSHRHTHQPYHAHDHPPEHSLSHDQPHPHYHVHSLSHAH